MTLYTGVTGNLARRISQHKSGSGCEFTSPYHFDRLVYVENYDLVVDAIAREKSIKGMSRRGATSPTSHDHPAVMLSEGDGRV